jgi:hypothetical protein
MVPDWTPCARALGARLQKNRSSALAMSRVTRFIGS